MNSVTRQERWTTTRDNILYLAIALGIVGAGALVAWYQEAHRLPIRMPISDKFFAFILTTAVVLGGAIKSSRKLWRSGRFWVATCLLLIVYVPLQWKLVAFSRIGLGFVWAMTFGELFCLFFILEWLVPPPVRHRQESSHQEP
jgi:hypothetical protein